MFSDILLDYINSSQTEAGRISSNNFDGVVSEKFEIKTPQEEELWGKPKGVYELISIPDVLTLSKEKLNICVREVARVFGEIVGKITPKDKVLVVGLGNRHISADSLGSSVVSNINITLGCVNFPKVMAIAPSVMGLTGIETVDIVQGVVDKVMPTHVILIDSLCASAVERLGRSIQITNTGICPGGGVGNKRKCIGKDMAKNVFSIGVPLLTYSSVFVRDVLLKFGIKYEDIDDIMQNSKNHCNIGNLKHLLKGLKGVFEKEDEGVIVSIKDIEECVSRLSGIISKALNIVIGVDGIND